MSLRTIVHKHASIYLVGEGPFVLFDCGWQDSFAAIRDGLRGHGLGFADLRGLVVSHFHPDHAGTVELLRRHGVEPLVLERQLPHIVWLNEFFTTPKNDPRGDYAPLDPGLLTPYTPEAAGRVLAECGIEGVVLYTPGHSDDSVSLVARLAQPGGPPVTAAFVGDLPAYEVAEGFSDEVVSSWLALTDLGVQRAYPAHGEAYDIA